MDMIIAKVGNAMGLPVNEIVSGVSSPEIIAARRLAMALCVRRPNFSISEVAARFEVLEGSVEESLKGLDGILRTYVITQKTPLELSLPLIVRDWINKVETDRQRPTIENIQREVCEVFNTRKTDLISARRDHPMVSFRHIGMAVARLLTTHSFSVIGQKFGRRDHTTVLHACRNLKPYTDAASARLAPLAPSRAWITAIGEEMGLLRPQS
jgi:chromosomal replication initiation ATPase DnaA